MSNSNSNSNINIKFLKLHEDAQLPSKAHDNDTGYDVYAVADTVIPAKGSNLVETGLQVAYIEDGYWFHIMPRSGLGFKSGIQPHLGIIDEGYRGSLGVKLYNFSDKDCVIKSGDRVAQLVFYPRIAASMEWSTEVKASQRGENGFGSSGN